jgi:mono/diheme cytochrome c family protein/glucose/arabinose dehydrogenase
MKSRLAALALFTVLPPQVFPADRPALPVHQVPMLSPEEELKTFQLPDGYKMELVLSDPEIKEPVLAVFDGNGRMYVAEMRTYMQDIDGNGELEPRSRISRHESTKGDGVFDRHSVYLDHLVLPRAILPLDDRVLVNVTNSSDITLHRDSRRDGVADESEVWYRGGPRGLNLEQQPSGLVWGLDNWIYLTCDSYRLRWNGRGAPLKETTPANGGQWGLAQDDYGKMWWSNGGAEKGLWNFQTPIIYGAINVPGQKPADFDMVWPLLGLADMQGGPARFRAEDKTLNYFTGCAGQTVFRGDRLPPELEGNAFLPEPVGRLIRRATVKVEDGITKLENPYPKSEFLRSTDPNFRPVNMTTGPDGCLYIVDMYRGIIQEGNWVGEGSYLRDIVIENGLQNNIARGRIWRLTHRDNVPGPQPHMLDETSAELVAHLEHPNGWWRDTAQRMLIVRGDKSVAPALVKMAETSPNHLARLHALWTLEGLDALTPSLVREKLRDAHPMVRAGAIRVAETLLMKGQTDLIGDVQNLARDPDPRVVLQTIMTGKRIHWPEWKQSAQAIVLNSSSPGVKEIGAQLLIEPPKIDINLGPRQMRQIEHGEEIFRSVCFACHGFDGKGMPTPGREGETLAPPLAGSKTVVQGDALLRVLCQGLSGPVNGRTYTAQMTPMGANDDEWIADVASYVRKAFGNRGTLVTKRDVRRVRKTTAGRATPWTIEELGAATLIPLEGRHDWKLSASHNANDVGKMIDGDDATCWSSNEVQSPGIWVQIEFPAETEVAGVVLDCAQSPNDYPLGYEVEVSADGLDWGKPALRGRGVDAVTDLIFRKPKTTRFLRITLTQTSRWNYWSIHELQVLKPAAK